MIRTEKAIPWEAQGTMDRMTGRPSLLGMRCQSGHPGRTGPGVSETHGGRWGRRGVHLGKGRGDGELRTEGSAERLEDADQVSAGL